MICDGSFRTFFIHSRIFYNYYSYLAIQSFLYMSGGTGIVENLWTKYKMYNIENTPFFHIINITCSIDVALKLEGTEIWTKRLKTMNNLVYLLQPRKQYSLLNNVVEIMKNIVQTIS